MEKRKTKGSGQELTEDLGVTRLTPVEVDMR